MQPLFQNKKKLVKTTIASVFLLVIIQGMLTGCATAGQRSGITSSQEATAIWHTYEVLPNYNYYYAGPETRPFYIIGIDDSYKLRSKLWKPVDLTPEMLNNWFNYYRPRVGGYNPLPYGAFILDPNGERIGLWYSVVDWRLTGSATFGENNEVTIYMPTNEGHLKRDQDPFQNDYDVSNEKSDDHKYDWLSSYSEPADQLCRHGLNFRCHHRLEGRF